MSSKMTWSVPGHQRQDTPSSVRWVPRSKEKIKRATWTRRKLETKVHCSPIDEQIRTQELHSQSLSPKKNRWCFCFSAMRVMSGKIVLVATCILVCTAPFKLCSSLTVQSAVIRKRKSGRFPNSAITGRAHHVPNNARTCQVACVNDT